MTPESVIQWNSDPRYNDTPGMTMDIQCPGESYGKMFGTEPPYNDFRCNDIPEITMRILQIEYKIFPDITIVSVHSTPKVLTQYYSGTPI